MMEALILMTRIPYRGNTKTRLMPILSPIHCEELHQAFLEDYFECFKGFEDNRQIFIAYAPENFYESFLDRIPVGYENFVQEGNDIGERMLKAFNYVFNQGYHKVVLVGCDIPHIQPETYNQAFEKLNESDIAICPTYDGGYCLIGMKTVCKELFVSDFKWGNQSVVERTYSIANVKNLKVSILEKYRDIDEYSDLIALQNQFNKNLDSKKHVPRHTLRYLEMLAEEKVI